MSRKVAVLLAAVAAAAPLAAWPADETSLHLADGPGADQARAFCSMCHSVDYILMNSPFQDRAGWEKTVNKMVKVMGAPMTPDDVAVVVAYLDSRYGKAAAQ